MVQLRTNDFSSNGSDIGPLLDNGAPYIGLGFEEFKILKPILHQNWNGIFDKLRNDRSDLPYWQYGSGSHASDPKRIIGYIIINVLSD